MQKENKVRNRKNVDLVMLVILVASILYFSIQSLYSGFIPNKYILIVVIVSVIIGVLSFLSLKLRGNASYYSRRIILGLLSLVLIVGGGFQFFVQSKMDQVDTSGKTFSVVYVIAKKDSSIKDEKDLKGKTIGYVDTNDSLTSQSVLQLADFNLSWESYFNQSDKLEALDEEVVDVVLMSAQNYAAAKSSDETFTSKYKVVYEIHIENEKTDSMSGVDITKEPFTVFVSGLDIMGEPNVNGLSDVNMLVMVDPINHHVELISINRDTYVPNPTLNDYPDKLTHLGWGGPELGAKSLSRVFDIPIDYTAKVTFESLIDIVDCLGGVEVDVKLEFSEQNENREFGSSMIHLKKGVQTLNGKQALAYARHRKTAGWDVEGREFAQRQVIQAIVNKILSPAGMVKVGDLMDVVTKYVSTNIPMSDVRAFVRAAIDSGKGWTFGSSKVDSKVEPLLPVASVGAGYRYCAVLLDEMDLLIVHNRYNAMFEETIMRDFAFELDNLITDSDIKMDPSVVTIQNYEQVVREKFPDFYIERGIWFN